MGGRDRKGINVIPGISMHVSEGVIETKEKKFRLSWMKAPPRPTGLKAAAGLQQAATGSGRSRRDSDPGIKTSAVADYGSYLNVPR